MASNNPFPNAPFVWRFPDYQDKAITVSVTFNDNTKVLSGAEIIREPGCVYQTILWGLGEDGRPDNTTMKFIIPEGTTNLNRQALSRVGLASIDNVLAVQITAGF